MSKSTLKAAQYSLQRFLTEQQRHLSLPLLHNRKERLTTVIHDLHHCGYAIKDITKLKPKHIEALTQYWQHKGLSIGTIKNRMSDLRFVAKATEQKGLIKRNQEYHLGTRHTPHLNKAIHQPDFSMVEDHGIYLSLQLQYHFGLRREEALKIQPHKADHGTYLRLDRTWTKGGIGRCIPITTEAQRHWLEQAKLHTNHSMIPKDKTYIEQRKHYQYHTQKAGITNPHGLRHAYAQRRYQTLATMLCPHQGGKGRQSMTPQERAADRRARQIVSRELGHVRIESTKTYLG